MATVKNTLVLQDKFTPVLRTMMKAMNSTVTAMAGMDRVSDKAFNGMKRDVQAANEAIENLNRDTRNLQNPVDSTGKKFSNWGANLGGAIYAVKEVFNTVSNIANKMDEINARSARADMVGGLFGTSGDNIESMVQQAANASRGNYRKMMSDVGKMGIMAKEAFANPKELVAFNEQLQKTFVIAGTGSAQIDSAMLQLTQAMASGVLRGEEFNAVFEAAPNIIQRIAEYTGKSTGEMRKMAEEGQLTADVVKYAMLSAAEQTNEAFNAMPMSFQSITNMIQTDVDNFLQPIAEKMSGFWSFIADNWSIVKPILIGITVALGALAIGLGIAAVAQWALNSAMLANPMTWIIVAIVALIAIITILVLWILDLWATNMDFKYGVIKIWNSILNFFDQVPIFFQGVGYGIADAFSYAKVKVLEIMQTMGNGVIGIINEIITAINKIPGVAITPLNELTFAAQAGVEEEASRQSRANNLAASKDAAAAKAAARETSMIANRAADEANIAAKKAAAAAEKTNVPEIPSYEQYLANNPQLSNAGDTAKKGVNVNGGNLDSIGKIDKDINISEDDLRLLKDVAVSGFTQQYTKLQPNLKIEFTGDITETADINKLAAAVEDMVVEAYASSLVGE